VEATEATEVADATEEVEISGTSGTSGGDEPPEVSESEPGDTDESAGKLRNRRPTGKGTTPGRRRRTRGGVAVED